MHFANILLLHVDRTLRISCTRPLSHLHAPQFKVPTPTSNTSRRHDEDVHW